MVGCRLTVANTVYGMVIQSFTNQWAVLKDRKRQTQPMVPNITTELPIMRWETALVSRPASVNRENLPHGEEFTSIEEEL
eukprot:9289504-Ditylum_brightwellii.AAC.1